MFQPAQLKIRGAQIPFYFFHMNIAVSLYTMLSTPSFLKLFCSAKS